MKRVAACIAAMMLCMVMGFALPSGATADDGAAGAGQDATAHFHARITTSSDTYTSGTTAVVTVKYTIDEGAVAPGDYVTVTIPENIASSARFSASKQHFSSVEELGGGAYRLVFGSDAATALSGGMTIYVQTSAEETTTGTIVVGDGEKQITVIPAGGGESGGVGDFKDEAIMKDGLGGNAGEMFYGDYDYSGDEPAQIGLFDSSVDHDFVYRLFINRKNVAMTNVTVTDTLPDGMSFASGAGSVTCFKIDPATMSATSETVPGARVTISGQTMTVSLGDIDYPVQIEYTVHVPAQASVHLRNHSSVTYTQNGKTHKENRDYIAQSNDYDAANGVKSVDKTIISDDPSDQWVTYTIRFWNDRGFAAGDISLTDDLDDYLSLVYVEDSDTYSVTVDENDPTKLHITNTKAIPSSEEDYVSFVVDFTKVPVGYTVENTVGGNTTKTRKVAGSAELEALKTVDGAAPAEGEAFTFELRDDSGKVLQKRTSDAGGKVAFGRLHYSVDDLGKTFTYHVAEVVPDGSEADAFTYDESIYDVTVAVADEAGEDGAIGTTVTIAKNGEAAESMVFDNKRKPEEPDTPDTPVVPEVPDVPDYPDAPGTPDTPDTPDTTTPTPGTETPKTPVAATKPAKSALAKTGDDAPAGLCLLLAGASLAVLAAGRRARR